MCSASLGDELAKGKGAAPSISIGRETKSSGTGLGFSSEAEGNPEPGLWEMAATTNNP